MCATHAPWVVKNGFKWYIKGKFWAEMAKNVILALIELLRKVWGPNRTLFQKKTNKIMDRIVTILKQY